MYEEQIRETGKNRGKRLEKCLIAIKEREEKNSPVPEQQFLGMNVEKRVYICIEGKRNRWKGKDQTGRC